LGLYHFDRIRDVNEVSGYSESFVCDKETLKQMASTFKDKKNISIKDIENTRNKLLEQQLNNKTPKAKKEEVKPLEICKF